MRMIGLSILMVTAFLSMGCAQRGPWEIHQGSSVYFTPSLGPWKTPDGVKIYDDVRGVDDVLYGDFAREKLAPDVYEQRVTAARAEFQARMEAAARDSAASDAAYRAAMERNATIRSSIYTKEYEQWRQLFLRQGFTDDEARYKAGEIMRDRF